MSSTLDSSMIQKIQPSMLDANELHSSIEKFTKGLEALKCCKSNECHSFCYNSKCNENGIVCSDRKCQCYVKHRKCKLIFSGYILENMKTKVSPSAETQKNFNEAFDNLFDQIARLKSQFIQDLRLYGLNNKQRQVWLSIQKRRYDKIKGSILNSIQDEIERQSVLRKSDFYFDKVNKMIKKCVEQLECELKFLQTAKFSRLASKSKIIENPEEDIKMEIFFQRQIKNCRLIYRASEHNFSANDFYKMCCDIPSVLILIKTEHNKKIGGYIPMKWELQNINKNVSVGDITKKSFLFSLTNNDKVELTDPENAIYYYGNFGPCFGGKKNICDLMIANNANINFSYCKIGSNYTHPRYTGAQSSKEFTGSSSDNFKVIQWQAFEVQFKA